MKTDINGSSTCSNGQESYEFFTMGGIRCIQYDYRTACGKLFSCVAKSLDKARAKRDEWLKGEVARVKP